ncbi:MAG: hypothetical protein ACI9OJ_000549, partial [Myxococcota bacterium]
MHAVSTRRPILPFSAAAADRQSIDGLAEVFTESAVSADSDACLDAPIANHRFDRPSAGRVRPAATAR